MYNIYNKSNVYYVWIISKQKECLIGDENDLIHYLAKNYHPAWDWWYFDKKPKKWRNPILDTFACNINEQGKEYQIFDGYGRCINPKTYEKEAFRLFLEQYKDKKEKYYWQKNYKNMGIFRYDPVPYSGKRRGGPSVRPRKIKHLHAMYLNPEYKEYNRGSRSDIPEGWWDDWYRCRQKSWKSQSKRRHRWKE